MEIWQAVNRSGFDLSAGFWGFVEIVTSRRCIDWLRAKRNPVPVEEDLRYIGQSPFEQLLDNERAKIASQVLEALEPECRKIIVLRLHEDLPFKEIAQIVDKSEGALRVQMYRCIQRARDLVNRLDPSVVRSIREGESDGPS